MIYLKKCPAEAKQYVADVFNGRFDLPVKFNLPPNVVDIGADIGAFTVWAADRWGGKVLAVEWDKQWIPTLQINTAHLKEQVGILEKNPMGDVDVAVLMKDVDILKIASTNLDASQMVQKVIVAGIRPRMIVIDYFGEDQRRAIDTLLAPFYILWGAKTLLPEQGTVKYVINSIKRT